MLLPVVSDLENVKIQMESLDGVILAGGYDIDPFLYKEEPIQGIGFSLSEVDCFYFAVIAEADRRKIPVFGICKGLQAMNVAFGGSLYQDLVSQKENALRHVQLTPRYHGCHEIQIEKGSFIYGILGENARVNSYHHQSVKSVAKGFAVTAKTMDGIVEALERENGTFMVGVQMASRNDGKIWR